MVVLFAMVALTAAPAKSLQDKASTAYRRAEFAKAAGLYKQLVDKTQSEEPLRGEELTARKRLVLSLFNSAQKDEAVAQYKVLKERFPAFRLDPDEVLDETIAYLEAMVPNETAPASQPAPAPAETATAVSDAPRVVASAPVEQPTSKRWHWYYLAPFGIGQYLAGSPVRGTVFLVLQTGFLVANIVSAVLFNQLRAQGGGFNDPARAQLLQIVMNVGFFGAIGTGAAGILDGAIFEP